MKRALGKGAGGRVAGESSDSGCSLSGSRIVGDHCAAKSVPEPRAEAAAVGSVIVQIFVQRCGNRMLDGGFDTMSGQARAGALAEARGSATPLTRSVSKLGDPSTSAYSSERTFSKSGVFPVLPIWMVLPLGDRRLAHNQRQQQQARDDYPHNESECKYGAERSKQASLGLGS